MDLSFRHDLWWRRLPASPDDDGSVTRIVLRPRGAAPGTRTQPDRVRVDPAQGLVGDRWLDEPERSRDNQVSLINSRVALALARGSEERAARIGDNLHVDLCLTEANLPVGTRLHIGGAVLEVSPQPHRPCGKFHALLGATAAKRVARANRRGLRGRGVLCRVVQAGEISLGAGIRVERAV